jgi:hypothetical protein
LPIPLKVPAYTIPYLRLNTSLIFERNLQRAAKALACAHGGCLYTLCGFLSKLTFVVRKDEFTAVN